MPRWLFRIPSVQFIVIGEVFYHELGHHIHRTVRPEFRESEDVAESWRKNLSGSFIRKRYWYLLPVLLASARIYRRLRKPKK
jgi:hypothetical protein